MKTGITCKTFVERMCRCSYFKEINRYVHNTSFLFNKILKSFANRQDKSISFLKTFADNFSSRIYSGKNFVNKSDRNMFRNHCLESAKNLDIFLKKFNLTNIIDTYNYKNKIHGHISGRIDEKNLNVWFSFKNLEETLKELDFISLNNYLYNITHKLDHSCLVLIVPSGTYMILDNKDMAYTLKRGFVTSIIKNKFRRYSSQCYTCRNKCKPMYFGNLERLESSL